MLNQMDSNNTSPLYFAIRNSNFKIANFLLEQGSSTEVLFTRDNLGHTLLYWAIQYVIHAGRPSKEPDQVIRQLIDLGRLIENNGSYCLGVPED